MSFLNRLLRPNSKADGEEIKPIENDPVSLIVETLNEKQDIVNNTEEQNIEVPSTIKQSPATEAVATPAKPDSKINKEVMQPYDPLISLLKVTKGERVESQNPALSKEISDTPEDEKTLVPLKQTANNVAREAVPQVIHPEPDKSRSVPVQVESPDDNRGSGVSQNLHKDAEEKEIAAETIARPMRAPAPVEPEAETENEIQAEAKIDMGTKVDAELKNEAEAEVVSPSAVPVKTEEKGTAAGEGGILDIFREEAGEDTRVIFVSLEQIDIQALWEESMRIRDMLNSRCRH